MAVSDTGAGTDLPGDPDSPDLEDAVRGMRQAIGRSIPPSGRIPYPAPDVPMLELSDITGDGCPELWTCVTWGSGMVRTDLVVYDPVLDTLYVLDGYDYDYRIDHAEGDRIVVAKTGPNGYGDPITKTYGTVQLENNELVFIADSGE